MVNSLRTVARTSRAESIKTSPTDVGGTDVKIAPLASPRELVATVTILASTANVRLDESPAAIEIFGILLSTFKVDALEGTLGEAKIETSLSETETREG
jgi:hypothetical protein